MEYQLVGSTLVRVKKHAVVGGRRPDTFSACSSKKFGGMSEGIGAAAGVWEYETKRSGRDALIVAARLTFYY